MIAPTPQFFFLKSTRSLIGFRRSGNDMGFLPTVTPGCSCQPGTFPHYLSLTGNCQGGAIEKRGVHAPLSHVNFPFGEEK